MYQSGESGVEKRRLQSVPPVVFHRVVQELDGRCVGRTRWIRWIMYVRVRSACMVDGMSIWEAARVFGLHRDAVRKMLVH